jgi:uncharacterized membrane protein
MARKRSLHAIPEPWDYNPSKWSQRIRICLVAAVATLIAIYMGLYQWRLIDSVWDPIFGSQSMKVLDSDLSHAMTRIIRLPDSILGALAYLGDIIFALAGSTRRWQDRPWLVIIFGLDVIPLGIVSAILVFMQGFVVHYFCFLCLVTAVISLLLVVLAYDEVWSCLLYLIRVYRRSKSLKIFWKAFIGQATDIGREVGKAMERGTDWRG